MLFVANKLSVCVFVTVKGMWERKPHDWPKDIKFLDPNNKIKEHGESGCKPTKDILVPMLDHLVTKYMVGYISSLVFFAGLCRTSFLI